MPSYLYDETEVIERKSNCHIMGNGTATVGAKYVNNDDVRIDIIVVRKDGKVQKVTTHSEDGMIEAM